MKKKIVYIIYSLDTGGVEVALLSALERLNTEFNFRLVCLKEYDFNLTKSFSADVLNNIVSFKGCIFNYFKAFFYIKKYKPDIMISSLWKSAILAIFIKIFSPSIKYVNFIHSTYFFHFFDNFFSKLAIKMSDIVFCDSQSSKKFVERYILNKPIEVISFLRFKSQTKWFEKKEIRLKALYLGRFHEVKRLDNLIYFANQLIKNGLFFEIDLYGRDDGTLEQSKKMICQLKLNDYVKFKGQIESERVQDIFYNYDFYFQTSDVEGMSMSVVEAMQHGLICVVTNVGEIKNYANDGKNALLFDAKNFEVEAKVMVTRVAKVLSDIKIANELSKNAFLQFYDLPVFSESLIKELKKI